MASQKLTIKARRRMTSATILGDGTLVQWFEIVEEGTYNTLRTEIEVVQNYVRSLIWRDADGHPDWDDRQAAEKKFCLTVACRYSEDSGYLPLLEGAAVYAECLSLKNGSPNTRNQGVRVGSVRIQHPKIGSVTFTQIGGLSSELSPSFSLEDFPSFEGIVACGYNGYMPVKVTRDKTVTPAAVAA